MKIYIQKRDITASKTDIIVNAANSSLIGGGGVDGAIHRAGGPAILEECQEILRKQGKLPTGEAVYTSGGNMPCSYVIHTVGPFWHGGDNEEPNLLANCYRNSLHLAEQLKCKSIAFPNISTGIYGYPKDRAASIAIDTVKKYQAEVVETVYFVCLDQENYELYDQLLQKSSR